MIENLIVATVAIGESYEREAARLKKCIGTELIIFDNSNPSYKKMDDDPLIDGLYHKTNFANYIEGCNENHPVLFCDADLFSLKSNPLNNFQVKKDTDIAYVPYQGRFHYPDNLRQEAYEWFNYKINSGFMYFKSLKLARDIGDKWRIKYLERSKINKFEYDEIALMYVLQNKNYNIELLDLKWNNWYHNSKLNPNTVMERRESIDFYNKNGGIFFQAHDMITILEEVDDPNLKVVKPLPTPLTYHYPTNKK